MVWLRFAASLALAAGMMAPALAANIQMRPVDRQDPRGGPVAIYVSGEIGPGDEERLLGALAAADAGSRPLAGIFLDSPGGSIGEATRMARTIRATGRTTIVASTSTCASACVLMVAAGRTRLIFRGARIGVHSASEQNGIETPEAAAATLAMAREAAGLGVPPAVIGRMVTTRASSIQWLSRDELVALAGPGGYSESYRAN